MEPASSLGVRTGPRRCGARGTGEELKGKPIPPAPRPGPISPDGRLIAHPVGNRVELIPLQPDAEELAYRRLLMQPNFRLYREAYDAAMKANDAFAARFYLNLFPPPERALHPSRADRRAPVRPLAPARRRARRPPGPTGGRSGDPGSLPEAGRNLARVRRSSATMPVGRWFATPDGRKRITSAACAWPAPLAGSSRRMRLSSIPWAWPSTAAG